jgi:glycosyltransferase involved in cell wall biosynthesis
MTGASRRVALLLPGLYEGGAERVMLNLGAGLSERGFAVDLVLAQAEGPYMDQVPDALRVVELNRNHVRAMRTQRSLPVFMRYLRREKPDSVLSVLNANFIALESKRLTGLPERAVICLQNNFSQECRHLSFSYRILTYMLARHLCPSADGIVAVSEGVADDFAQAARIQRARIRVIYNPIVTAELATRSKEPLKHPWFEPGSPPVILAVGRLTPQKDFGTLIRAFARVRQTRSVRLLILGEGEERPNLEALVKELGLNGYVQLHGFVSNPYPYMANASLFALSSRFEGLPTVLVEALYCGAQIVATNCPSGPEEILNKSDYGHLVPVGNEAALAQAINESLSTKKVAPPSESWQPYTLDAVIDRYLSILFPTGIPESQTQPRI